MSLFNMNKKSLAFALLLPTVDAWFPFQRVADRYGEQICDESLDAIGISDQMNCDCDSKFSFRHFGFTASADCDTKQTVCLDGENALFCGTATMDADFGKGGGFDGTVNVCLDILPDLGLPGGLEKLFDTTLCVSGTAKSDGFAFSSCEAIFGDACKCEPCGGDDALIGVDIDCSGVNINPMQGFLGDFAFIPGPNPGCLSLALGDPAL